MYIYVYIYIYIYIFMCVCVCVCVCMCVYVCVCVCVCEDRLISEFLDTRVMHPIGGSNSEICSSCSNMCTYV